MKPRGRSADAEAVKAEVASLEEDSKTKTEALAEIAKKAPATLEASLDQLESMQVKRRKDSALEKRYAELRTSVVAALKKRGPAWFKGHDGQTYLSYLVEPERLVIDIAGLEQAEWDGDITLEVLDEIAPRQVDLGALRKAVASGRVSTEVLAKAKAEYVPGTAFVKTIPWEDTVGAQRVEARARRRGAEDEE